MPALPTLPLATRRGSLRRLALVACLGPAIAALACGKKGPPLAPLAHVPAAPSEVTAVRSGDQVTLRFTIPRANTSNVQPADIERVDVYAWTGQNLSNALVFDHATVIATVPVRRPPPPPEPVEEGEPPPPPPPPSTEPGLDQGAIAEVTETLTPSAYDPVEPPEDDEADVPPPPTLTPPDLGELAPPLQRHYAIVGVNRGGSRGAPARAAVPLWPAPAPPTELTAAVRERGVDLTWHAPPPRHAPVYAPRPAGVPAPAAGAAGSAAAPIAAPPQPNQEPASPPAAPDTASPAAAGEAVPSPGEPPAVQPPVSSASARGAAPDAQPQSAQAPDAQAQNAQPGAEPSEGATAGAEQAAPALQPLRARLLSPWHEWTTGFVVFEVAPPTLGPPAAPPPAAQPFPRALTAAPITAETFTDPRVEFGAERCYTVRSVERFGNLSVQSANAAPACIKPKDVFPPAAPKSLAAVASPGAISLIWEANAEADLGGYLVYRRVAPDGDLQPLTPEPIRETTFRDETVTTGTRYIYIVVAVDASTPPNVSPHSNQVEETAR